MKEQLLLIKSYLMNIKAVVGILIILYSLYSGFTDIPAKWGIYFTTTAANGKLVESKNSLNEQEAKLKAISNELDKLTSRIVRVEEGNSPELAVINVAQKVADLSETTKNTYVSLNPGKPSLLNVEAWVNLPVNIPGIGSAATAAKPGKPGTPGATAPPPPPPPPPSGGPPDPSKALNSFQYHLEVKGTFINLVTYIHQLSNFPDFVIIDNISLFPPGHDGSLDPDLISMKMDFTVPWQFGKPLPPLPKPTEVPPQAASSEPMVSGAPQVSGTPKVSGAPIISGTPGAVVGKPPTTNASAKPAASGTSSSSGNPSGKASIPATSAANAPKSSGNPSTGSPLPFGGNAKAAPSPVPPPVKSAPPPPTNQNNKPNLFR